MPNPTVEKLYEGCKIARENEDDFILAVGGGSVITNHKQKLKIGHVFGENVFPKFAILSPEVTFTIPDYHWTGGRPVFSYDNIQERYGLSLSARNYPTGEMMGNPNFDYQYYIEHKDEPQSIDNANQTIANSIKQNSRVIFYKTRFEKNNRF